MPNEKLDRALAEIEREKASQAEAQKALQALHEQQLETFLQYRDEVVLPIFAGIRESLEARGYAAQIVNSDGAGADTPHIFVELIFAQGGPAISAGGPSVVVLFREGVELLRINERPEIIDFAEERGHIINVAEDDIEDLIVEFIVSKLK